MEIQISKRFTFMELLRFAFPTIVMLVISSVYTTVDGIFVSRFVGSDVLSVLNIVAPLDYFIYGIAVMFGSGASAIIGRKLGEGKNREAKENFTLNTITALIFGAILTLIIMTAFAPIAKALGASGCLMTYCMGYGKVLFSFAILQTLKNIEEVSTNSRPPFKLSIYICPF